jgi:dihydrofolate synthase/folylpolyglutamate synthase
VKIATVEQAGAYLEGLINVEKERSVSYARFDLEPIRRLLARLGDPHRDLCVVHIAGSKGKGSTAYFAESLLCALGQRVGTFTSPHLVSWTERFRIDGSDVDGAALAAAVERVAPHVDAQRAEEPEHAPTFFDATTAVAMLLFRDAGIRWAVVEVGLGGRLDSTNVVAPKVCCVTSIEREHTEQLGDTLAEIAAEKAGIIKPGVPVVVGDLVPEAARVVAARAAEVDAPSFTIGREIGFEIVDGDLTGQRVRIHDGPVRVETRLSALGNHQAHNAALALACVRRAQVVPDSQLADLAARGLAAARLPARIELLGRDPWLLVDSAHTATSASALAEVVKRIPYQRAHWVLSISAGKDAEAILNSVTPLADSITVTRADPIRSLDPQQVAQAIHSLAPGASVSIVPNPHLAVRAAREALGAGDLLAVAGSFYLAGIARSVLSASDSPGQRVVVSRRSERIAGASE